MNYSLTKMAWLLRKLLVHYIGSKNWCGLGRRRSRDGDSSDPPTLHHSRWLITRWEHIDLKERPNFTIKKRLCGRQSLWPVWNIIPFIMSFDLFSRCHQRTSGVLTLLMLTAYQPFAFPMICFTGSGETKGEKKRKKQTSLHFEFHRRFNVRMSVFLGSTAQKGRRGILIHPEFKDLDFADTDVCCA